MNPSTRTVEALRALNAASPVKETTSQALHGLLADLLPDHRPRERLALWVFVREQGLARLRNSPDGGVALVCLLADDLGLAPELVRWAAGAWAAALDIAVHATIAGASGAPTGAAPPTLRSTSTDQGPETRSASVERPAREIAARLPRQLPSRSRKPDVSEVDDSASIGDAIAAAAEGSVIRIAPGRYYESLVLDRSVVLMAAGSGVYIKSVGAPCVRVNGGRSKFIGISFENRTLVPSSADVDRARVDERAAVVVQAGEPSFERCHVWSLSGAGLTAHGRSAVVTLRDCTAATDADLGHDGIVFSDGASGLLEGCTIDGAGASGLYVGDRANPTVRRGRFLNARKDGIYVGSGAGGTYEDCESSGNERNGISVRGGANPAVRGCRFTKSRKGAGIAVYDRGKGIFENCESSGNTRAGIEVHGGADPTLRGCRFTNSQESSGIIVHDHGRGSFEDCESSENQGCGISVTGGADPTVRECRFAASRTNAGIHVYDKGKGTFVDCESTGNNRAGISVRGDANPMVRGCRFTNSREGAGIHVHNHGEGTFVDCQSSRNKRAGIEVHGGANPTVRGCRFTSSRESAGIVVYDQAQGTFEDCESSENQAYGIFVASGADPTVRRCRFTNARRGAGIMVAEQGKGTFEDCESFENQLEGIDVHEGAAPRIRRCRLRESG